MTNNAKQDVYYLQLLRSILWHGEDRTDRTGTGTRSRFAPEPLNFDLQRGFPLLTTKKVYWKGVVHELLWFLKGDTNTKYLKDNGVNIWDEWADKDGDIGPGYGKQWRAWSTRHKLEVTGLGAYKIVVDQISELVAGLKKNPDSRRHIVSAWNVGDLPEMKLPPCHMLFQCYVSQPASGNKPTLSLQMYQRSADTFLGLPWNIASYALLTHMLAHVCGYEPGRLSIVFGDAHIYSNHFEQVKEQLSREPRPSPTLKLNPDVKSIFDFKFSDFSLSGYDPHPAIPAKVSV